MGDPLDEKAIIGPMISQGHLAKVRSYIELGPREGARLLCGGLDAPGQYRVQIEATWWDESVPDTRVATATTWSCAGVTSGSRSSSMTRYGGSGSVMARGRGR